MTLSKLSRRDFLKGAGATGGYDANPEMMQAWVRPEDYEYSSWWNPSWGTTGDGRMMGLAVGAEMDSLPQPVMNFSNATPSTFVEKRVYFPGAMNWGIMVTEEGKRFTNENNQHGLVLSDRMENGYRVFTPKDAFRSNAFRVLLQYGFSISEAIEMLDAKQDTAEFRESLQEQRQKLERERILLDYRQRRIESVLDVLETDGKVDFKLVHIPDQLYVNASHGRDLTVSMENEKVLAEYYDLLSITSCARIITRENLLDDSPAVDPDYINIASVEERHFLSDYAQQRVKRLELGRCVRFRRTVTREESVRKETFDDLFACLDTRQLAIRGDILIMPMFLNLDGEGSDIEVLYVPVNDQEASDSASSSGSI